MTKYILCAAMFGLLVSSTAGFNRAAFAGSYPVSGKWTYEDASGDGAAKECGSRFMNFQGEQRFDTGGGVPGYHNFSIEADGSSSYNVIDQFATGQITARMNYNLRKVDDDHIELRLANGGKIIKLRRCE